MEGMQSWEEQKNQMNADFHLDPEKQIDPVEDLLHQRGPEGAVAELEEQLQKNPDDEEARRQMNLIHNRLSDLLERTGSIVRH